MASVTTALIGVCLFIAALGWMAARRRFLVYLMSFLWLGYTWRLLSTVYIDVAGPVYAVELFREIGGGHSALVLSAVYCIVVFVLFSVFGSRTIAHLNRIEPNSRGLTFLSSHAVRRLVLAALVIYLSLLWIDFVRIGVAPIASGIEELVYTRDHAGLFHRLQFRFGNLLAFFLGLFYFDPALSGRRPDRKFLAIFFVILFYMLLTGHRYSAFYSYTTFFIMPFAAVSLRSRLLPSEGRKPAPERATIRRLRWELAFTGLVVVVMVVFAVSRSLVFYGVAEEDAARAYLTQRVFVQQGELWWGTYERIFVLGQYDPYHAVRGIFTDPIVRDRNTTTPYLMEKEIGATAYGIIEQGSAYSGGFPEIAFELFGSLGGFVMIGAMTLITGRLLVLLMEGLYLSQPIRVFFTFYVLYAFILFHASGMLNSLVNWKFWIKVLALVMWLLFESMTVKLRRSRHFFGSVGAVGRRESR